MTFRCLVNQVLAQEVAFNIIGLIILSHYPLSLSLGLSPPPPPPFFFLPHSPPPPKKKKKKKKNRLCIQYHKIFVIIMHVYVQNLEVTSIFKAFSLILTILLFLNSLIALSQNLNAIIMCSEVCEFCHP